MSFSFVLARGVTNTKDIMLKLKKGEVACGVVDASMVYSLFLLQSAGEIASTQQRNEKMTTKHINSEIVFALSPAKNIAQAYTKFGPKENSKNLIFCLHDDKTNKLLPYVKELVSGSSLELLSTQEQLSGILDIENIKKTYKLSQQEITVGTIEAAIVTKIAVNYLQ